MVPFPSFLPYDDRIVSHLSAVQVEMLTNVVISDRLRGLIELWEYARMKFEKRERLL